MKNKRFSILIGLCSVAVLVVVSALRVEDQSEQRVLKEDETVQQPESALQQQGNKSAIPSKTATAIKTSSKDTSISRALSAEKQGLMQIAQQYEAAIAYPSYSRPIRNEDDLYKYLPNQSVASEVDLDPQSSDSTKVMLKLGKFQYQNDENIEALIQLSLAESVAELVDDLSISASIVQLDTGKFHEENKLKQVQAKKLEDQSTYQVKFAAQELARNAEPYAVTALQLVIEFDLDGQLYRVASPFEIHSKVAELTDVGASVVAEEHLLIPLYNESDLPGYYRISANLYDEVTGEALVHLSERVRISSSKEQVNLKAHIAALKKKESFSAYLLKDINISRLATAPHYRTMKGSSRYLEYRVNAFPQSAFLDKPYIDKTAQKRLEFLQQLANSKE